jgi:hypothetical protein
LAELLQLPVLSSMLFLHKPATSRSVLSRWPDSACRQMDKPAMVFYGKENEKSLHSVRAF